MAETIDFCPSDVIDAPNSSFYKSPEAKELHACQCEQCNQAFMFPVEALEIDDWRFAVKFECTNCNNDAAGVFKDDDLERVDVALDRGTKMILKDLEQIAMINAREDFARFICALESGAILPEDF